MYNPGKDTVMTLNGYRKRSRSQCWRQTTNGQESWNKLQMDRHLEIKKWIRYLAWIVDPLRHPFPTLGPVTVCNSIDTRWHQEYCCYLSRLSLSELGIIMETYTPSSLPTTFDGRQIKQIAISLILNTAWCKSFYGAAPQTPFFLPLPLLYHQNVMELSGKFGPFLQIQGNIRELWTLSLTSKNSATYSNYHFSALSHYLSNLCPIIYSVKYIYGWKVKGAIDQC